MGCTWSARRGMWVRAGKREGLSLLLETKPRTPPPMGCVAQPRGRLPAGKVWDRIKGQWIVPSSSSSLLKTIKSREPVEDHISVLVFATSESNPKSIHKTTRTHGTSDESSQADSTVPPGSPLLRRDAGSIEIATPPTGTTLPSVLGSGEKSAFHSLASPSSSVSVSGQLLIDGPEIPRMYNRSAPTPETDNRTATESNKLSAGQSLSNEMKCSSPLYPRGRGGKIWPSISKEPKNQTCGGFGGFLLSKNPPKLLSNGTFQRPQRGLSPVNYTWDGSLGVWIPSAVDLPFNEEYGVPRSKPVLDEDVHESRKRKRGPNHDSASSIARRTKYSSENKSPVEESKGISSSSPGESR